MRISWVDVLVILALGFVGTWAFSTLGQAWAIPVISPMADAIAEKRGGAS